ncbi:LysR family transcriptional regulator [Microbacterium sp. BH-3-3-3]|uniref:LysR family transcriptional regulator n=1 Tax=Microbacterium sp. BH-3-3-3 TaxID=1906742 RepID=UPI0011A2FE35|nr:LysR family transcriptional regulator [Microbacterium sp. BH-3-3-3]
MEISSPALRYFAVLAEELHFTRAAQRLRISPPSLSQQISRLEKQVGRQLFLRTPRAVELTTAGRELVPLALQAVAAHEAVARWARASTATPPLQVGIVATGAGALTSDIIAETLRRLPDVRVELRRLGFMDVERALIDGTVDLVLSLGPAPADPRVDSTTLLVEPRVLVVREEHPLASRDSVSIDETNGLDFVVPVEAHNAARAWWLVDPRPDGSTPRVVGVADGVEGLMDFCVAGVGVNIATASAATHYGRAGLAYVEIDDIAPAEVLAIRAAEPSRPEALAVVAIAEALARRRTAVAD